jgi:hypothetical protein
MNRNNFQFSNLSPRMATVIAHYGMKMLATWDLSNA